MIETTFVCDNCDKKENIKPHTQFSKLHIIGEKDLGKWHVTKIDNLYLLLCKECRKAWKQFEKETIAKGKKEFFKK